MGSGNAFCAGPRNSNWGGTTDASADTVTPAQLVTMQQTNVAAQTAPQTENSSYNKADQGNYAALDSVQLNQQGQLEVSGWHATNLAADKPQHYLIVLDTSDHNRELGRINVTNSARPDVARVFPGIINAAHSGFTGKFTLPDWVISRGDTLNVISRYTSSADGNSDYVDYWFAPVQLGQ